MAGFGPPPKAQGERRNRAKPLAAQTAVQLPAEGRQGDPPAWPLNSSTSRERTLWAEAWSTPQAVAWERMGWTHVVARYVRVLSAAESRKAATATLSEVRQLEDRLGLSPLAMLRLRWAIVADEVAVAREENPSVRRLKAVDE